MFRIRLRAMSTTGAMADAVVWVVDEAVFPLSMSPAYAETDNAKTSREALIRFISFSFV
jgi:hypothetical protein